MMKRNFGVLIFAFLLIVSCSRRITDVLPTDDEDRIYQQIGTDNSFELATWNIENFPKSGSSTIENVKTIIRQIDVDLIAVQEITSIASFNQMVNDLDGWRGVLSSDTYSSGNYQKTGILYKSTFISVSNIRNIFEDDGYSFPRPPLAAFVEIKDMRGTPFDFNIIVLHLKASGGETNEARRRSACEKLQNYIAQELTAGADPDFIVMGDWNDELDDPAAVNSFNSFLNLPDLYSFLTSAVLGKASYISTRYNSLIDHILITRDVKAEFGTGQTQVLYLDNEFNQYPSTVSDHRPVAARFAGFTLQLQ